MLNVASSDESIATAYITDNTLYVTAQETTGDAMITISGEHEGYVAAYSFQVSVISPNVIPVIFNLYDSYGDGWQYSGNQNYIQLGEHYITLESGGEGQVIVFLEPGTYDYTYTAADSYGDENSWTINLEDGTELGAGQGGTNGTSDFSFVLEPIVGAPEESTPSLTYSLGNYPNPFNPETTIKFSTLNSNVTTEIIVFNIKGQKIKTLVNDRFNAGNHSVTWSGTDDKNKDVVSGVYFYKMKSGKYTTTKKMILMK
jgi:Secretion system C-terminal sorting domain